MMNLIMYFLLKSIVDSNQLAFVFMSKHGNDFKSELILDIIIEVQNIIWR